MVRSVRSLLALSLGVVMSLPTPAAALPSSTGLSVTTLGSVAAIQPVEEDAFSHMTFRQRERLARRVFKQAQAHDRRGEIRRAIEKYEQTYRLVPNKHGLAFIIGMAYKDSGNCEQAAKFFDRLIRHGGTAPRLQDKVEKARTELSGLSCYEGDAGSTESSVSSGSEAPQEPKAPIIEDSDDEDDDLIVEEDASSEDEDSDNDEYEEDDTPEYTGPSVDQAGLDENPLSLSREASRKRNNKAFRRANSRGFLISGIVIGSLGAAILGGAGFLHWKSQDTARRLLKLTQWHPVTRFPTTPFTCEGIPQSELSTRCAPTLIKDFETYRQYTPIAYGVGGGLLGLGLSFILIKQIRMARYRKRTEGKISWHAPQRLNITPYRLGQRLGARASLRF